MRQPAVSYAVAEMEHALGVPLLERSSEGVTPTIYGEVLLERSRCAQVEDYGCATSAVQASSSWSPTCQGMSSGQRHEAVGCQQPASPGRAANCEQAFS
jgi:Bacterial regulatory helix-turn-helix protein, lysR family